jgi:succinate dehydrogenase / fumarate reductase flavoprotein subunit
VVLATGGYGNVFYLSTNAKGCNVTAIWRAHKKGAGFANPCFTQIHPTCIPVSGDYQSKLTLMSESLRNDGRVWVPKKAGRQARSRSGPEGERDYILERKYPSYGNLAPRDVSSRASKEACDAGKGVGPAAAASTSTSATPSSAWARTRSRSATATCSTCTRRSRARTRTVPMRIYPAVHYTMGGLWVDYNLMSTVPGLHVVGEANFSITAPTAWVPAR